MLFSIKIDNKIKIMYNKKNNMKNKYERLLRVDNKRK